MLDKSIGNKNLSTDVVIETVGEKKNSQNEIL